MKKQPYKKITNSLNKGQFLCSGCFLSYISPKDNILSDCADNIRNSIGGKALIVQAIGSKSGFGGVANTLSSADTYNDEIKLMQDQKANIQKQIDDIKTGKQNQEQKDQQVKILQQQLAEINAEIQQKQLEQAKDKFSDQKQKSDGAQTHNGDRDRVEISGRAVLSQLQLSDLYNRVGKFNFMSKMAKGRAGELKSDAEIAASNGNTKVAATLSAQCGSYTAAASSEVAQAAHEASKVNNGEHGKHSRNNTTEAAKKQKKNGAAQEYAPSMLDTAKQMDERDDGSVQ